jgi:hypothetical protein
MIDANIPWNVKGLGKLMDFSNGDIEEIKLIFPDLIPKIIDLSQLSEGLVGLGGSFKDGGIDTPFIIESHG